MEYYCSKCDISHSRPIGRRCIRVSMATNISTTQAHTAVSAVRPPCRADMPLSSVSSWPANHSTAAEDPGTSSVAISRAPSALSARTKE